MPDFLARLRRRDAERADADALERAYARLRSPHASAGAAEGLNPEVRRLLQLSLAVSQAAAELPAPRAEFADALEVRLRAASSRGAAARKLADAPRTPRRTSRPRTAFAAAAACLLLVVGVGQVSARSLPGDALYGLKRAGEGLQIRVLSDRAEALLRVDLAGRRIEEAADLVQRHRVQALGLPGRPLAAAVAGIDDPKILRLVQRALDEAETQMRAAAVVLIKLKDPEGLRKLVEVAQEGRRRVSEVAAALPPTVQPPALATAVAIERIEQLVQAARQPEPTPTPGPCATPTPEPTPSSSPSPTPVPTATPKASPSPKAAGKASPSPTPTPTASAVPSPSPTPCVSPSPAPSAAPSPAATPGPTAQPSPEPTPAPSDKPTPAPASTANPESVQGEEAGPGIESSRSCWRIGAIIFC